MVALRNVSKTAHYFNTPTNVTGFFVKISNQLTIDCRKYLTDNGQVNIWQLAPKDILTKIEKCHKLVESYKEEFFANCQDMADAKEKRWVVSAVYIFSCLNKFLQRLDKV